MRALIFCLIFLPITVIAHGDSHKQEIPKIDDSALSHNDDNAKHDNLDQKTKAPTVNEINEIRLSDFSFAEFTTLHPMIVHLPVMLIPLALLLFMIALFSGKAEYRFISTGLIVVGFLSTLLAAFPFHPHTSGLPAEALATLKKHDFFAYSTIILAGIASVFSLLTCSGKFKTKLTNGLTLLALLFATTTVSITGHYGGTLSLIHGVGAKGQYIQTGSHQSD